MCFLIKKTKSYNLNDSPKSRSFSQGRNGRLCSRPRSLLQGPTTGAFSRQIGGQQRGSPGGWCVPGCGCTQRPQTPWRAMVSPSPEPPSSKTAVLRFLPPNYHSSPFQRCLGAYFLSRGLPHQARSSLHTPPCPSPQGSLGSSGDPDIGMGLESTGQPSQGPGISLPRTRLVCPGIGTAVGGAHVNCLQ